MSADKGTPVRFSLLTVLVWLLVAAGVIFLLWQLINRISGSTLPIGTSTPNPTQVSQTIVAVVTAQSGKPATSAPQTPTSSSSASGTETPTAPLPTTHNSSTQGTPAATTTPVVLCNQAAAGNPIDITIPDDSLISPGQSFIKTWKLTNVGICTWDTSYSASFFYGDRMGAPESVSLQEQVRPAQSVEVSVEMVAPMTPGTYQGNWKLADPSGALFGIGPTGGSAFWVRITVKEGLTPSPTISSTPTATSIPSGTSNPTPEGQLSGELAPLPGDSLDLDAITLNSAGADLVYQVDADQYHWLAPQGEAEIGVYGSQEPKLENCQAAGMSPAPIAVESLSAGTYLCYRTGEGRFGKMLLDAVDPDTYALTLDLLTWPLP